MSREASVAIAAPWRRIVAWIMRNVPEWAAANGDPLFRAPASQRAIDRLAQHVGGTLPDQVRALLRLCDGCREGDYPLPSRATRPTKWRTLSAREMAAEWDRLRKTAAGGGAAAPVRSVGPVRPVWWHEGWIPLCDCGMGDVMCVDTAPQREGRAGQLILYAHDFGERKVLYPKLADWLRECADDLESGAYTYVPGVGLQATQGRP